MKVMSAERADHLIAEQKDRNIMASEENIKPDGDGWICTDGRKFDDRGDAVNHQYDLERFGHA